VGKPEEKRPLGRPRHRWVDNTKMDIREIGWDDMGSACSTNGEEEMHIGYWWENQKVRDH
jgi:hypothetical protein